jgi:hypothetical protein
MPFGKPPIPKKLLDEAHQGPETYEMHKLEAQALEGFTLQCGCVARNKFGSGELIRACFLHKDNRPFKGKPMVSNYDGVCITCHKPIRRGAPIYWEKGKGAWHEDCPATAGST